MSTITVTGWVCMTFGYPRDKEGHNIYSAPQTWRPELWSCQVPDTDERVFVGTQEFDCVIPDNFDPTAKQVAALEAAKQKAMDQYQRTVADINARLSKLLAITNEVEA